ncbi:nitroreductase family protein [Dysgonomonas capnocytophagoides]|uniref:nitroreductase family protein n=1 Tax=Dysgonomonas capnocytophagoides TaxID=45254 RepID=UPI00333EE470
MSILEQSQWRYATKKFDPSKKVNDSIVAQIIEAARLAPTSSGLQPYKVLVIINQELKDKIATISMGQTQAAECSHLLVFAGWDNYTEERIDHIYSITTQERGQAPDRYKAYTDRLKAAYLNRTASENFDHIARQSYIAFAYAIAAAAELKVDATPMEGFDNKALDELLGLNTKGLKSVTMLPLGYRDAENDWLVNQKKVRHPESEFVITIK